MDFKQLQSYVAVVSHMSFTKAASQLFVSQPTISAHVRALEEELGCRLILRTTKSIEVTAAGKEVFSYARNILDLKERMARACDGDERHIIHLGASTIPAAYLLPELLSAFGKQHPGTYFSIHQSDSKGVAEGLCSGMFELGLLSELEDEQLTFVPLCRDRMVLIAPVDRKYLDMPKESDVAQLLRGPIILREQEKGGKRADRFLEKMSISADSLHVAARVNDQETVKNLVAGGLGVSLISEIASRNFVKEKRVLSFELPIKSERTIYLAYKKQETLPTHIRAFADFAESWYQRNEEKA